MAAERVYGFYFVGQSIVADIPWPFSKIIIIIIVIIIIIIIIIKFSIINQVIIEILVI